MRIVQPGEFSIGPHADVAYGHHACSVNFYVPLTQIFGTNSLFIESSRGEGDFHPLFAEGVEEGANRVKHFAGALCSHWTTENKTAKTRTSADVRLIHGDLFEEMNDRSSQFVKKPGYYQTAMKVDGEWVRGEDLMKPDARVGYPWT